MGILIHQQEAGRHPVVSGVFAAMTLPRTVQGSVHLDAFAQHLDFLHRAGIAGFVLNGATGEYCLTSPAELGQMIARAREITGDRAKLLAAIGGASYAQVMQRLEAAESAGADGLLLPMPHFFPYEQRDLIGFAEAVALRASLPVLLYNLPAFTTPLEPKTTLQILSGAPRIGGSGGISGIKDSSGSLDTVRLLAQELPEANRVIGNDGALYGALAEGLCDGVVSGVACVLPELMKAFYSAVQLSSTSERTLMLKAGLDEVLDWLGRFPVPWGLKMLAAERGLSPFDLPLPLAADRGASHTQFLEWFRKNRSRLLVDEMSEVAV